MKVSLHPEFQREGWNVHKMRVRQACSKWDTVIGGTNGAALKQQQP